ncbi:MAG: TrkA family potassium uptake protein [Actinomycetaceae bacterium]|nr:TrkA family potassium uptake protein [Actinomycetaceae bacterium]
MARFTFLPRLQQSSLEGGVVIIGLGRFGAAMGEELVRSGVEVLGIDNDPGVVQAMNGRLTSVVRADASNVEVLRQLGVQDSSNAVVAIGTDLASSILAASALIKLDGPEIWAKAATEQQGEIFAQMGIKHVFHPEKDMGVRAAHLLTQSLSDFFDLGNGFAMATTTLPPAMGGNTISQMRIRYDYGVTIVGVKQADESWAPITPDTVLRAGQTVLVAGPSKKLDQAFVRG